MAVKTGSCADGDGGGTGLDSRMEKKLSLLRGVAAASAATAVAMVVRGFWAARTSSK